MARFLRSRAVMIHITKTVTLDEREIKQRFVRAIGPRGGNADRDATAVELRLDITHSSLPLNVRERLTTLGGRHVTTAGVLTVVGRADRSQAQNRSAAYARLFSLLQRAATPPTVRTRTAVPAVAARKRQSVKQREAATKQSRKRPEGET